MNCENINADGQAVNYLKVLDSWLPAGRAAFTVQAAVVHVPVVQRDIFDDAAIAAAVKPAIELQKGEFEKTQPPGNAWGRVWLWELGTLTDRTILKLRSLPFLLIQGVLLVLAIIFRNALIWGISKALWQVRYRLITFEEFMLLVVVILCYAGIYAMFPSFLSNKHPGAT